MRCEELSPGERSTGQVEGTGGNWGLGRAYKDPFKPVRERLPSQLNKWTDDRQPHEQRGCPNAPRAPRMKGHSPSLAIKESSDQSREATSPQTQQSGRARQGAPGAGEGARRRALSRVLVGNFGKRFGRGSMCSLRDNLLNRTFMFLHFSA